MNGILTFKQWTGSIGLNENVKAAKQELIKRYVEQNKIEEITPEVEQKAVDNRAYNKIREIVKGNDGYVYAFLLFYLDHKASIDNLEELYNKIKSNAGALNTLPMTIEEYSKQELVNGVNPFEALMDQFYNIEERRKYRWIIDKVNGDLRRSIKTMSPEDIEKLYKAAKLIDKADEEAGDFTDPDTGRTTNNRISLLVKSNAFSDGKEYLDWVEKMADGVSNSDVLSKVNALRALQPEAGILYNKGGYLAMSIRTEHAQKELCSVANWCINRGSWGSYGGLANTLQYNIFNFNLPVTNLLHITGTTISESGKIRNSHNKNDDPIIKSSDPYEHFTKLGYPEDLAKALVTSIPVENQIKEILTGLKIDLLDQGEVLISLVKTTYMIDLDAEKAIRNVIIGIIRDQLSKKLSRSTILELFLKYGVLSTFSARILNILIPDLADSEKTSLLNFNDQIFNEMRTLLRQHGTKKFPSIPGKLKNAEQIKDIIISGESITDTQD
ncbi:hypothetical protein UFOVP1247_125 [uncultured Caudovirales phage]|uniref:Uncharacterized protein n=1 Tax=uncultured Caudovirales phage TaxID=2100421 RepID=A0A6J5Q726_9CAUD|nr:hypothetical protein UFOVP970_165 [uncultured Caudovirales phage]CAB4193691.1 hypothetical protein UFOVP1247_125 [uncultured Caudovirales phage]